MMAPRKWTEQSGEGTGRPVFQRRGRAAQNVHLQHEALELGTCMIGAFREASVKKLLGLLTKANRAIRHPKSTPMLGRDGAVGHRL